MRDQLSAPLTGLPRSIGTTSDGPFAHARDNKRRHADLPIFRPSPSKSYPTELLVINGFRASRPTENHPDSPR